MALTADIEIQGGFIVPGAYVRIRAVDCAKKDYDTGTFYACADVAVYKDEGSTEQALVAPSCQRVKVNPLDLEANPLAQLYAQLKADLIEAGVANVVDS